MSVAAACLRIFYRQSGVLLGRGFWALEWWGCCGIWQSAAYQTDPKTVFGNIGLQFNRTRFLTYRISTMRALISIPSPIPHCQTQHVKNKILISKQQN